MLFPFLLLVVAAASIAIGQIKSAEMEPASRVPLRVVSGVIAALLLLWAVNSI